MPSLFASDRFAVDWLALRPESGRFFEKIAKRMISRRTA
jgi:hypothetical protein